MDDRRTTWLGPTVGLVACVLVALVSAACGNASGGTPAPSMPYGAPIEAGPMPDGGACQDRLRSDIAAAVRIRGDLAQFGVASTDLAARAAAADPTSDTKTIGIPMTTDELAILRKNGLAMEPADAISNWVNTGAPERFGGIWTDGGVFFVTVVDGDPETLVLARCLEAVPTRYLWADVSQAEGRAIQDRIGADWQGLNASGVGLNLTYYDVKTGLVVVGVTAPTPQIEALLRDRYGPRIRVIQQGPVQPA